MTSSERSRTQTGRQPSLDGTGLRVAVAVARFNDAVNERLLAGARATLAAFGVAEADIVELWVPGAYELPLVAKKLAESGRHDAVIAIGSVIRGDTPHFEYVAGECAAGLTRASLDTGVPIVFGVLTVDTVEQAEARAGGSLGNKGDEFAATAIEMAALMRSL
jgi:6,7-dimethyl-8-ribityllumazine synthase